MHIWELDSLEAQNEVLAGLLEGEVRALRRRKAEYEEARRLSDGSDSCWSDPDGDSDNESAPELAHHLMHYKKEAIVLIIRKILTKYIDHDPKFLIFTNANPVKRI
jgi:hypothetical protein